MLKQYPTIHHHDWNLFVNFEYENQILFQKEHVPERIFCFWTGNNKMSDDRSRAMDTLLNTVGVDVQLITRNNLDGFLINDAPLHPAYEYLSYVHRADYLRCYFMHHHGGGYSDIKGAKHSWIDSFRRFNQSTHAWISGYPEIGKHAIAPVQDTCGIDLAENWYFLLGNGAYICAPKSPFTQLWYQEVHNRLDIVLPALRDNPGNACGDNVGYPIEWTYILGNIFHPLCLLFHKNIMFDRSLKPILGGYQ
ncbi:MAG: hypothetical protein ACKO0Y_12640, partial [Bacteroidota bacterium]